MGVVDGCDWQEWSIGMIGRSGQWVGVVDRCDWWEWLIDVTGESG